MRTDAQDITHQTYEDPTVVEAFLKKNGEPCHGSDHISEGVRKFADLVSGSPLLGLGAKSSRILDVGCGPGIHARQFARLGFDVTAIDYSSAMIDAAVGFPTPSPLMEAGRGEVIPPTYRQLDMREIGSAFPAASFDAAWASASLIHVPEANIDVVLNGIQRALTPGGLFHVSLKGGNQGPKMVHDTKYGLPMEREFTFWQEDNFTRLLKDAGFDIVHVEIREGGITGDEVTTWLIFTARRQLWIAVPASNSPRD